MKKLYLIHLLLLTTLFAVSGQESKKVLFIGNSYTAVNNLPLLVSNLAGSTGDTLIYDSNAPGGFRFMNHASNAVTLQKISAMDWDYVVLQAQSQETSLSLTQMQAEVYPYAESLCNSIRAANECAQPMFYMTWGRKYGDQSNCPELPWVCTYEGMDDAIRESYTYMSEVNVSELSPVGAVWRALRTSHPEIELYSSDNSHPSLAGSYAAACSFYTLIYKKDPTAISWNATLTETEANSIKMVTKSIVFDDLDSWDFTINPAEADFTQEINDNEVSFTNTSSDFDSVFWDFGDASYSTDVHPVHIYQAGGDYTVSLTVTRCGKTDEESNTITIESGVNIEKEVLADLLIYPNPAANLLNVKLDRSYKYVFVKVSDFSGKIRLEKSVYNADFFQLEVSALSPGTYVVSLNADDIYYSTRISKL
ncbi:MAG: PKD domain-containing protein [Lentimicrobium sp.]|jgi:PKD repeat protein|nr:PKD domain-containing protein [Lentimicrobium sp.]